MILLGGVMIRIRTVIDSQTIVARGIEPVALSSLREGESVEVTYHCRRACANWAFATSSEARSASRRARE